MYKNSKIVSVIICLAIFWVCSACSDEVLIEDVGTSGVDMNRIVEVEVPFGLDRGLTSHIVTRADGTTNQTGKDSQLSGIMVFVYENKNTGKASDDPLISFQLFQSPLTSLDESTGGWIPAGPEDNKDYTKGYFKLYLPIGDVYIYLIGNAAGSFGDFFPDRGENKLTNREDFLQYATPKWNGNMFTVDGYLPLVGTVNNDTGACRVEISPSDNSMGILSYKDRNGTEHTISQSLQNDSFTQDNSFVLKRLMCKVSMKFKSGPGVKFTPKTYRFRHCSLYIPPTQVEWSRYDKAMTRDTQTHTFDAQTPDSFTVYLPENIREYTENKRLSFVDRDKVKKVDGINQTEVVDGIVGPGYQEHKITHYVFENAPSKSTYVEIIGEFEGDNVSADTKYLLHLGDFSNSNYNEFSLCRDYHYQYTVTVKGVNDIIIEVNGEGNKQPYEKNPAVEGIVFQGGARLQLDAHYEQVEMKLEQNIVKDGVYIYAQTPFGNVSCKYLPATKSLEGDYSQTEYGSNEAAMARFKQLLQWIEFKKQSGKGQLAIYAQTGEGSGTGKRMNVFEVLDDAYQNTDSNNDYYTCFVDEYYYTYNPINDKVRILLSDFINADDRTFSMGSSIKYSADKHSAVASAVYVLHQHAISCFYDLNNPRVAKYGVEVIDEIGDLAQSRLPYGVPATESNDVKLGRTNTEKEIANGRNAVNWVKNGFLLDERNTKFVPSRERLSKNEAYLACLARNRDFNGDGSISSDELRWYTPARDQVLGLWIGEPALPAKAALYPFPTSNLEHHKYSNYPIYTSTNGDNRVIWAEEGCSFGNEEAANKQGYVRAVRNIGAIPSSDSYAKNAEPYYQYDSKNRTIEVLLTSNALRAFSSRELAPHHERSVVNRPYKMFQVASHPYVVMDTVKCGGHSVEKNESKVYSKLQTTSSKKAKMDATTIAANYDNMNEAAISHATWRLPNQRELALMVVAMGKNMDYDMDFNKDMINSYHHMNYECTNSWIGAFHNWKSTDNYVLHCRTAFSNQSYAVHGYMYNTKAKLIQQLWTKTNMDGNIDLGQGRDGQGGYLCVRDVPAP